MKPENKKFLDDNRHFHTTLTKAFYLKGLNADEREGMQRVMREEFQPTYTCDLWCPNCCAEMVKSLYRLYDDWLAKQVVIPEPTIEAPTLSEVQEQIENVMQAQTQPNVSAPEEAPYIPSIIAKENDVIKDVTKKHIPSNEPRGNTNTFNSGIGSAPSTWRKNNKRK